MAQIYLISPENIPNISIFLAQLEEIFSINAQYCKPALFQLRLKNVSQSDIKEAIVAIKPICEKYQVSMVLNDDISLALEYGIGLHVGSSDANLQDLELFKQKSTQITGVSCYNSVERARIFGRVADYVSFGAIFPSLTKKKAQICEKSTIIEFCNESDVKVAIIGGISSENIYEISDILDCVDYICVLSDVWN